MLENVTIIDTTSLINLARSGRHSSNSIGLNALYGLNQRIILTKEVYWGSPLFQVGSLRSSLPEMR